MMFVQAAMVVAILVLGLAVVYLLGKVQVLTESLEKLDADISNVDGGLGRVEEYVDAGLGWVDQYGDMLINDYDLRHKTDYICKDEDEPA